MLKNVAIGGETPRNAMEIAAKYLEIDLVFFDLPSPDHLATLPKISDSAIFFEALAEETKKAGIKSQKLLAQIQRLNKTRLTEIIENLSGKYDENFVKIREYER